VGGFYGALLARQGHDVAFLARGAHLDAIRAGGLRVDSPLGRFTVRVQAEADPTAVGAVDVVVLAVKTYDNATALPMIPPLVGPGTTVVTLQNGVESADEIAAVVGEGPTLGGSTYIATEVAEPGLIRQTGTHRRVVIGEYFADRGRITPRVEALVQAMSAADIVAEAAADARQSTWEKATYLAPLAGFTGAARLPIGPIWADPYSRDLFLQAVEEVGRVARAHGIAVADDLRGVVGAYIGRIPPTMRSSLLIDLSQGKRIEVEALQGAIVRKGREAGVPTPIMAALYAVLRPHAGGAAASARQAP
jgi:2-dehydropantoate 2-reductase